MASMAHARYLEAMARRLACALALMVLGCPAPDPEPEPSPEQQVLAASDGWVRVTDAGVDLFADMRPDDAFCDDSGYYVDPLTQNFEVETAVCDYLTVRQATLVAIAAGDVIEVRGIHGDLTADTPATGYVGLSLDGELVWELSVDIPANASTIEESFTVEREFPEGSEAQLHVHNHGPNTWEIVAIDVTPGT